MANPLFGGYQTAVPLTTAMPSSGGGPVNALNGTAMSGIANASAQGSCNVIYVANMEEVLKHPRTPNEHLYFPETSSNTIWVRETDGNAEIKNPLIKLTYTSEEVPFGPEANYVTKREHQELYELVASMNGTLNKLMQELGGTT